MSTVQKQRLSPLSSSKRNFEFMSSEEQLVALISYYSTVELCTINTKTINTIMNTRRPKLLTKIKRFSIIFMLQFTTRDWTCGSYITCSCTMITLGSYIAVVATHSWCLIQDFWTKHRISQIPNFLDMAPYNFWLFSEL